MSEEKETEMAEPIPGQIYDPSNPAAGIAVQLYDPQGAKSLIVPQDQVSYYQTYGFTTTAPAAPSPSPAPAIEPAPEPTPSVPYYMTSAYTPPSEELPPTQIPVYMRADYVPPPSPETLLEPEPTLPPVVFTRSDADILDSLTPEQQRAIQDTIFSAEHNKVPIDRIAVPGTGETVSAVEFTSRWGARPPSLELLKPYIEDGTLKVTEAAQDLTIFPKDLLDVGVPLETVQDVYAGIIEVEEFKTGHTQTSTGDWVKNEDLALLNEIEKTTLLQLGVEAYNKLKQEIAESEQAQFERTHTQTALGEWIKNEELEKLDEIERATLLQLGTQDYAKLKQEIAEAEQAQAEQEWEKTHTQTATGEWINTTNFESQLRKQGYTESEIAERLRVLKAVGIGEYPETLVAQVLPLSSLTPESQAVVDIEKFKSELVSTGYTPSEIEERLRILEAVGPEKYPETLVAQIPALAQVETQITTETVAPKEGALRTLSQGDFVIVLPDGFTYLDRPLEAAQAGLYLELARVGVSPENLEILRKYAPLGAAVKTDLVTGELELDVMRALNDGKETELLAAGISPEAIATAKLLTNQNYTKVKDGYVPTAWLENLPPQARELVTREGLESINVSVLEGKSKFDKLQKLGFIPQDTVYAGTTTEGEVKYSSSKYGKLLFTYPEIKLGTLTLLKERPIFLGTPQLYREQLGEVLFNPLGLGDAIHMAFPNLPEAQRSSIATQVNAFATTGAINAPVVRGLPVQAQIALFLAIATLRSEQVATETFQSSNLTIPNTKGLVEGIPLQNKVIQLPGFNRQISKPELGKDFTPAVIPPLPGFLAEKPVEGTLLNATLEAARSKEVVERTVEKRLTTEMPITRKQWDDMWDAIAKVSGPNVTVSKTLDDIIAEASTGADARNAAERLLREVQKADSEARNLNNALDIAIKRRLALEEAKRQYIQSLSPEPVPSAKEVQTPVIAPQAFPTPSVPPATTAGEIPEITPAGLNLPGTRTLTEPTPVAAPGKSPITSPIWEPTIEPYVGEEPTYIWEEPATGPYAVPTLGLDIWEEPALDAFASFNLGFSTGIETYTGPEISPGIAPYTEPAPEAAIETGLETLLEPALETPTKTTPEQLLVPKPPRPPFPPPKQPEKEEEDRLTEQVCWAVSTKQDTYVLFRRFKENGKVRRQEIAKFSTYEEALTEGKSLMIPPCRKRRTKKDGIPQVEPWAQNLDGVWSNSMKNAVEGIVL